MVDTEERRGALRESIERFAASAGAPPDEAFLREVGGRSPRDIAAHLIGWNRHAAEGYARRRRGERPFCLVEPGEDFSEVNAQSMRRYTSRDKGQLPRELRASWEGLDRFLGAPTPAEWEGSYGVTYHDHPFTIKGGVEGLLQEYGEHRAEIEHWEERAASR